MDEMTEQGLGVILGGKTEKTNEKLNFSHQTNPIVRKFLDFNEKKKEHKFSVIDFLKR